MQTLDVYELGELYGVVRERIDETLFRALIAENRTGEPRTLLKLLLMDELVAKEGANYFSSTCIGSGRW